MIRELAKRIPAVRRAHYKRAMAKGLRGQSDEGTILRTLCESQNGPKTFVEFGFHPSEFNSAELMADFDGLLIDGNPTIVADARKLFPRNIRIEQAFLTLDNLDFIRSAFPRLGILSVDVDGNDYWFLEALIGIKPSVIAVEYNASFGLESVTVPYDPSFDRLEKHASGWYHGVSLPALAKLAGQHGYGLAAVSQAGGNAFFTADGKLDPVAAWKPASLRDRWSGTTWQEQWEAVRAMPLEQI